MSLDHESVDARIATMLRDYPRGTTADITSFAVAFLDRDGVRYAFLGEDRVDRLDEEFAFSDYELEQWQDDIVAFLEEPSFTHRPEVLDWLRSDHPE
jgi:hypothetical protein